eukprot:1175717-Prorocentrum_minimum.AAC.4
MLTAMTEWVKVAQPKYRLSIIQRSGIDRESPPRSWTVGLSLAIRYLGGATFTPSFSHMDWDLRCLLFGERRLFSTARGSAALLKILRDS